MADQPVAIVTGACSGIGLALTRHLLTEKSYRVVLADTNSARGAKLATEFGPSALFIKTDVSSWESQAALFKAAYAWGGRIDMLFANAGIFDQDNIVKALKAKKGAEPTMPDMSPFTVNLNAVIYGVQLFLHYVGQTGKRGGKIVLTASVSGTYPIAIFPMYSASKAGLIAYARSLAPRLSRSAGVSINVVCPSFVDTAMTIDLADILPPNVWTPMSTLLEAFDVYIDDTTGKTGTVIETTGSTFAERGLPPTVGEAQLKMAGTWGELNTALIEPWDAGFVM